MRTSHHPPEAHPDRWVRLTAGDIMQTGIITVADSAPLSEVERVLSENRIGGVPVTDQSGRVIGVVSVRDLIDRYVEDPDARPSRGRHFYQVTSDELEEDERDFSETPEESEETAGSIMTADVYHVPVGAPIVEVARKMASHRIHRVLVTEPETGRVVGIISSMGILAAISA